MEKIPLGGEARQGGTMKPESIERLLEEAKEVSALLTRIIEGREWGAIEEIADSFNKAIAEASNE